jgi:hypothetical protein
LEVEHMGSSTRFASLASLAGTAADFIAAYPEAAAFCARKLEQLLHAEECRAEEREREERDENRRRGFGR